MTLLGWSVGSMLALFGGGASFVTAMYLLRMRRRQVVVPFAALWQRVARENEARRLWRRLRRLSSWLLQLVLLALLVLALGDPRTDAWLAPPRTLALVIDASASAAGTTADGRTRLDVLRERAHAHLGSLGPDDRVAVIAAGLGATVLAPLGAAPSAARQALGALRSGPGEADLARAVALARATVRDRPSPQIVILTDGAVDDAGAAAVAACVRDEPACTVHRGGDPAPNVGITAFAARRYPGDRERFEALATVRNFGEAPARVTLAVTADGADLGTRAIELAPGATQVEVLPDLDAARTRLAATLRAADATDDPAAATALGPAFDDVAWAVVPPLVPQQVALITDGTNLFTEAALLVLDDHVELEALTPAAAQARAGELGEFDVVIIDVADAPLPSPLPPTNLIVFDPWRREDAVFPLALGRRVPRPFLTEQAREHPVLAHIVLKDVNVAEGTTFALEPGDEALVRTLGEPMVALRAGPPAILAIGFDPRRSDLPLRTAFPLLLDQALAYVDARAAGFVAGLPLRGSSTLTLAELGVRAEAATRATLRHEPGAAQAVAVERGVVRVRPAALGIYTLTVDDGDAAGATVAFAVNQASEAASAMADRLAELPDVVAAADPAPTPAPPVGDGPWWTWLVLAALALLTFEWLTYHRRVTV